MVTCESQRATAVAEKFFSQFKLLAPLFQIFGNFLHQIPWFVIQLRYLYHSMIKYSRFSSVFEVSEKPSSFNICKQPLTI